MVRKLDGEIPAEVLEPFKDDLLKLDQLPVGLRYRFDTWSFKDNKEALRTIGCERWLENLYRCANLLTI